MRKVIKILLAVVPVVYFVLSVLMHFNRGLFYTAYVDPEYFHLLNGINMAIGNLAVDYIYHPGTTLEVIYALSSYGVNLFQPGSGLVNNVLANPEAFIHGASILLNLLTALAIYLAGFYTYKYIKNAGVAIAIQLMPFLNYQVLLISGRLIPETALIAPILLLSATLIVYIHDENRTRKLKRYLLAFAIIGGLGVAGKMLYVPFLLIPMFVLPSFKVLQKYVLYLLGAIVLFAFPVFVNFGKSWEWYSGMLMHSGRWGSGSNSIIDPAAFITNFIRVINIDKQFLVIVVAAAIELMAGLVYYFISKNQKTLLVLRVLSGVLMALLLSLLMVAKHFAPHYLFPTLVFKGAVLLLMVELPLTYLNSIKTKRYIYGGLLVLMMAIVSTQVRPLMTSFKSIRQKQEFYHKRVSLLEKAGIQNKPLIISSTYRGAPFMQKGLSDALLTCGGLKSTYKKKLAKTYPNTFSYYYWLSDYPRWKNRFFFWDEPANPKNMIAPKKPLYVFIGEDREESLQPIIETLEAAFPEYMVKTNVLYQFESPKETLYKVLLVSSQSSQ